MSQALLDSNIDWGQDLFYLKDWLMEHPEVKLNGLAYWGSYPAILAGVSETPLHTTRSETDFQHSKGSTIHTRYKPGWYALSINFLYDRTGVYRYFRQYEPVDTAGYSINIYHITCEQQDWQIRGLDN